MLRSVLILTLVVLGAAAYRVVWQPPPVALPAPIAAEPADSTTLAVNEAAPPAYRRELPTLATLSLTTERPLFVQSRRPDADEDDGTAPAVTAVEAPVVEVEPPRLVLTAVIRTEGVELVLLQDLLTGEVKSLRPGEMIGGWQVSRIETRRVLLEKDGATHEVELRDGSEHAMGPRVTPPPSRLRRLPPSAAGTGVEQQPVPEASDEGEIRQ